VISYFGCRRITSRVTITNTAIQSEYQRRKLRTTHFRDIELFIHVLDLGWNAGKRKEVTHRFAHPSYTNKIGNLTTEDCETILNA
jgi:hypothetical protein